MKETKLTVLVVDDDDFYLEQICEQLEDANYATIKAETGLQAWNLLKDSSNHFDAILLDRMMPEMDGMEVLKLIKADPLLSTIPVVLQTGMTSREEVLEGLQAAAYYYLTKPFDKDKLLAIVQTAVNDYQKYCSLQDKTKNTLQTLKLMDKGQFSFSTLKQGQDLVTLLSNSFANGEKAVMGLSELVINAIEHGNLGITYEDKTLFKKLGSWREEVERRLLLPENIGKTVSLSFERSEDEIRFLIQDEGNGFDWQKYLEISPERAFDTHGRGIAMANILSFDSLTFPGNGNQVVATINLKLAD